VLLEKVRVVLNDIKEEGLKRVFKTHIRLARATRAVVQAFGLSMIAPDNPADSTQEYLFPMAWMEAS
jgi:aspartate aminotransferase-like enzyme